MAYQVSKKAYQQLHPTFTPGYPYENKYHNIGQLRTPYIGKRIGQGGDYGPVGDTLYYTPKNSTYPYPMDSELNASQFLPTEGSCYNKLGYFPCIKGNYYPDLPYIPPDYFSPHTVYPKGHLPSIIKPERENYEKLPVTYPPLKYATNFPPFNNYY